MPAERPKIEAEDRQQGRSSEKNAASPFPPTNGFGERCKLSQQRPGQSPDRKRILGTEEPREPGASFRGLGTYRPPKDFDFIFFRVNRIFEMALHCCKNNTLYVDRDPHGPPVIY